MRFPYVVYPKMFMTIGILMSKTTVCSFVSFKDQQVTNKGTFIMFLPEIQMVNHFLRLSIFGRILHLNTVILDSVPMQQVANIPAT